jgi:hypothetical protein
MKRAEPKSVESLGDLNTARNLKIGEGRLAEGVVSHKKTAHGGNGVQPQKQRKSNLVQKQTGLELSLQNGSDKAPIVSPSTSQKNESVNMQTDSAMRGITTGMPMRSQPVRLKFSTSTSTECWNLSNRGNSQRVKARSVSDEQRVFSAKEKMFATRTAGTQYRPRNSTGNKIKSVAPGTKPRPRWCPTGITPTQKRRVQRLRVLEIKEEIAKKNKDEWFNEDKLMVPLKMTWKEKCIVKEENRNTDDTVAARNSENSRDAPTDMRVDLGG